MREIEIEAETEVEIYSGFGVDVQRHLRWSC